MVRNAVCVVDREEGGADALARLGVRLRSLYRQENSFRARACKTAGKPASLSQSDAAVRVSAGFRTSTRTGGVASDETGVR